MQEKADHASASSSNQQISDHKSTSDPCQYSHAVTKEDRSKLQKSTIKGARLYPIMSRDGAGNLQKRFSFEHMVSPVQVENSTHKCSQGHPLKLEYPLPGLCLQSCDRCTEKNRFHSRWFSCRLCDFDLCPKCMESELKGEHLDHEVSTGPPNILGELNKNPRQVLFELITSAYPQAMDFPVPPENFIVSLEMEQSNPCLNLKTLGYIPLPLVHHFFQEVKKHGTPSKVNGSLEISLDLVTLENPVWDPSVVSLCAKIAKQFGIQRISAPQLHQLLFLPAKSSFKGLDSKQLSLIMVLPNSLHGGSQTLRARLTNSKTLVEKTFELVRNLTKITCLGCFRDTEVEFSDDNLLLVYSFCEELAPGGEEQEQESSQVFQECMNMAEIQQSSYLVCPLSQNYSPDLLRNGNPISDLNAQDQNSVRFLLKNRQTVILCHLVIEIDGEVNNANFLKFRSRSPPPNGARYRFSYFFQDFVHVNSFSSAEGLDLDFKTLERISTLSSDEFLFKPQYLINHEDIEESEQYPGKYLYRKTCLLYFPQQNLPKFVALLGESIISNYLKTLYSENRLTYEIIHEIMKSSRRYHTTTINNSSSTWSVSETFQANLTHSELPAVSHNFLCPFVFNIAQKHEVLAFLSEANLSFRFISSFFPILSTYEAPTLFASLFRASIYFVQSETDLIELLEHFREFKKEPTFWDVVRWCVRLVVIKEFDPHSLPFEKIPLPIFWKWLFLLVKSFGLDLLSEPISRGEDSGSDLYPDTIQDVLFSQDMQRPNLFEMLYELQNQGIELEETFLRKLIQSLNIQYLVSRLEYFLKFIEIFSNPGDILETVHNLLIIRFSSTEMPHQEKIQYAIKFAPFFTENEAFTDLITDLMLQKSTPEESASCVVEFLSQTITLPISSAIMKKITLNITTPSQAMDCFNLIIRGLAERKGFFRNPDFCGLVEASERVLHTELSVLIMEDKKVNRNWVVPEDACLGVQDQAVVDFLKDPLVREAEFKYRLKRERDSVSHSLPLDFCQVSSGKATLEFTINVKKVFRQRLEDRRLFLEKKRILKQLREIRVQMSKYFPIEIGGSLESDEGESSNDENIIEESHSPALSEECLTGVDKEKNTELSDSSDRIYNTRKKKTAILPDTESELKKRSKLAYPLQSARYSSSSSVDEPTPPKIDELSSLPLSHQRTSLSSSESHDLEPADEESDQIRTSSSSPKLDNQQHMVAENSKKQLGIAQKKARDPNAPKPAKSAYQFFCDRVRPDILRLGITGFGEISTKSGELWRTFADKSEFERLALIDKRRFQSELAAYQQGIVLSSQGSHPVDCPQPMDGANEEEKKKTKRDPKAPRPPKTPYQFFSEKLRPELAKLGITGFGEVSTKLSELWKAQLDKSTFEQSAAEDRLRYQEEVTKYQQDHQQLVAGLSKATEAQPVNPGFPNSSPLLPQLLHPANLSLLSTSGFHPSNLPILLPQQPVQLQRNFPFQQHLPFHSQDLPPIGLQDRLGLNEEHQHQILLQMQIQQLQLQQQQQQRQQSWPQSPPQSNNITTVVPSSSDHERPRKAPRKKDPNVPKAPKTAYQFFCDRFRPILAQKGITGFGEASTKLSALWKNYKDKMEFENMAQQDKVRFQKDLANYQPPTSSPSSASSTKILPNFPSSISTNTEDEESPAEEKRNQNVITIIPSTLRSPRSAYSFFCERYTTELAKFGITGINEVSAKLAEIWNLSKIDKREYETLAHSDLLRYQGELSAMQSLLLSNDSRSGIRKEKAQFN